MKRYIFSIDPVIAPTMVSSDKYKKRPQVLRYFAFKDHLLLLAKVKGLHVLPGCIHELRFCVQMPKSWSIKKKDRMRDTPHAQVPDIDNFLRATMNTFGEDSHIHTIRNLSKVWSDSGSIIIEVE